MLCLAAPAMAQVQQTYPPGQQTYPGQQNYPGQQSTFGRDTLKPARQVSDDELLDSLRRKEERQRDTVIFTSKFIKVTNERLLSDSTQVFPLDTTAVNFENYNPLYQPRSPRISLGNTGLPQRPLLFEPQKSVGFDLGLHTLDLYLLNPSDIQYYRARVPYTNLYYIGGGRTEQIFKLVHTQNVKPNWNVGANFNVIGSNGIYLRQAVSHINAALFNWYESKNKRYNLLANAIFNTLKSPQNGGLVNDEVFDNRDPTKSPPLSANGYPVKLTTAADIWSSTGLYVKQFYYIGRIDSLRKGSDTSKVLPTNRISHTFHYNTQQFKFLQNEKDTYKVFPDYFYSATGSRDSLVLRHLQNEFTYSFYLRGKSVNFVKNELKVDLGLVHDFYSYSQNVLDSVTTQFGSKITQRVNKAASSFQNITLKARLGYRFSDRVGLDANLQQVAQGYNFGDFLYDAKLNLAGNAKTGRIVLEAYSQSNKAPFAYTNWISNHYIFNTYSFNKQKTTSLSFNYINNKLQFDLKAEYFLLNDYLYFTSTNGGIDAHPAQAGSPISLFKISAGKNLSFGHWHFDNFVVYQKTDNASILRTPDVYTYSNLYYNHRFFTILDLTLGSTVRYNTKYLAPSYATGLGQFYNGANVTFNSMPVATAYLKAALYRTNILVQYNYANQGLFSDGYYTVNRYPMPSRLLVFGVSWTFYQ
ncbi:putative porin [Mucilaginibacter sp. RS28]|uniref:Porin n=2 Tax=Mucilaginibacter straminoryzae TaxID=2932774 RepID=A0A9X2BA63_9SPHI|nr:putative porin [Mucilaginibacter straminoryzae]